ncbi:hypothetical protein KI387_019095, partial [Taxus chinensis]
ATCWNICDHDSDLSNSFHERIRIRGITRPRPQWKSGYDRFPLHSSDGKVVINTSRGNCGLTPSSLGLIYFDARGHYCEQEIADLSIELVWLRWYKHGQRNLPSRLSLKNLRILELYECDDLEELWEAYVDPPLELRELIIGSRNFQKFPSSFGHLINLKKIIVGAAYSSVSNEALISLPHYFCFLSSLEHLELKCENLSELPSHFGHLKHLRHLVLRQCKELRYLPVSFKHLTLLQHLELYECGKLTIESDILENMRKLEYLNFSGCHQLQELPSHITNQAFLKELHLQGTRLKDLPSNIGQLSKLERLKIGCPILSPENGLLTSLPTSIGNLSCLRDLFISGFTELEYLPETFRDMTNLETLDISWCPIRELGLGSGSSSHSSLQKLKMINLRDTNVYKISISEDCCPSIETLDFMFNHHLTEIETLPTSVKFLKVYSCKVLKNIKGIRDLVNLQKLKIFACPELEVLPSFERLSCLKDFKMEDCGKVKKIQGLEHCRSLSTLCIYWKVFGIESLKHPEELNRLELCVDANILSVEPYIQMMQKWPPEMILCGRQVPGVNSLVNLLPLAGLTMVEPVVEVRRHWLIRMKPRKFWILRRPVIDLTDAAIVCFVINCRKENVGLYVQTNRDSYSMRLGRGKWVWVCVLTHSNFIELEEFKIEEEDCQVEMGILVTGQQRKITDALYQLLKYGKPTTNSALEGH